MTLYIIERILALGGVRGYFVFLWQKSAYWLSLVWQAFRSDASTGCGYMSELTPCLKDSKDSISRYIRWS